MRFDVTKLEKCPFCGRGDALEFDSRSNGRLTVTATIRCHCGGSVRRRCIAEEYGKTVPRLETMHRKAAERASAAWNRRENS